MTNSEVATPPGRSIIRTMAERFGMEPDRFEAVLRATVVPKECSREQFAAFLLVAAQYKLNPITREIYAFPKKGGGGIQPIVGVDGWVRMINDHPEFDGMEFVDGFDADGMLSDIMCRIFRKDRSHPVAVTEYLAECALPTEPWKKWPARMLRHKALIQAARYAFGFSGVIDPDEFERFAPAPDPTRRGGRPTPLQQRDTPYAQDESAARTIIDHAADTGQIQAPEQTRDMAGYVQELEAAMADSTTAEQLADLWSKHVSVRSLLSNADAALADEVLERHRLRIEHAPPSAKKSKP